MQPRYNLSALEQISPGLAGASACVRAGSCTSVLVSTYKIMVFSSIHQPPGLICGRPKLATQISRYQQVPWWQPPDSALARGWRGVPGGASLARLLSITSPARCKLQSPSPWSSQCGHIQPISSAPKSPLMACPAAAACLPPAAAAGNSEVSTLQARLLASHGSGGSRGLHQLPAGGTRSNPCVPGATLQCTLGMARTSPAPPLPQPAAK
jgi:hypothetical protein